MTIKTGNSIENTFRIIKILYFAILSGQLVFFAVAYLFQASGDISESLSENETFKVIAIVVSLSSVFLSQFLYNKLRSSVKQDFDIDKKLNLFRGHSIIRMAVLEAGNIMAILAFMLTSDLLFVIIFTAILILFLYTRPSRQKFATEYFLSGTEKSKLGLM